MKNRIFLISSLVILLVGSFFSCTTEDKSTDTKKDIVTLKTTTLDLEFGSEKGISFKRMIPSDVDPLSVIWTSSNPSVATVSSEGVVTAVGVGEAIITMKTTDGSDRVVKAMIKVKKIAVTGITLNKTMLDLKVGGKETLTAVIVPTNATNKAVIWTSDKPTVAKVSDTGEVTAVALGTATITATTVDGNKTDVVGVKVTPVSVVRIVLNKEMLNLEVGSKEVLTAVIVPTNAFNKAVTWTSDKPTVATVSSGGEVTAVGVGTVTITVKTTDGNKTATATVNVSSAATKPTAPTNLVASTITTTTIQLTWTAPSDNGKNLDNTPANLTKYTVTYTSGSVTLETKTVTTAGTTLSGLLPSTIYTITVSATNTAGQTSVVSNELRSTTTSAATKPTAPTNLVTSIITTKTMEFTWSPPSDNGKNADGTKSEITKYTLFYKIAKEIVWSESIIEKAEGKFSFLKTPEFQPDTTYSVKIKATNTAGQESAASDEIVAKTLSAATKPSPPIELKRVSSTVTDNISIPLDWKAPIDRGKNADGTDSKIKKYSIFYEDEKGAGWSTSLISKGEEEPLTNFHILNNPLLRPGTTYVITIKATNTAGLQSDASNLITITTASAATKPIAPTSLIASSGITTTSIPLTWTAPSDNGKNADGRDSNIKDYTVSYTPAGGGATQTKTVTTAGTTLSSLLPSTIYTITVSAVNTAGLQSDASNLITTTTMSAATKPVAPTSLTASSGITTTSIPLTWTVPSDNGKNADGTGSSLKEYTVSYTTGVTSATKKVTTVGTVLTGLLPGSTYVIKVSATNTATLESAASNEITSKTLSAATKPTAPTNLAATSSGITISTIPLTWTTPSDNGKNTDGRGSNIKEYTVSYTPTGGTTQTKTVTTAGTMLTGLLPGSTYVIKVSATNTATLESTASNEITSKTLSAATKPTVPTNLAATSSGITISTIPLTWITPSDNGKNTDGRGSNIKEYTVSYTPTGGTTQTKTVTTAGTMLSGLLPGTVYTITVSATNTAGQTSVVSNELRSTTTSAATKPVAPTSLTASSGITTTSIPLTWTVPSDNGKNTDGTGSSLKEYTVSYTPTGGTTQTKTVTTAGTMLSGLLPGTVYTITVSAANTTGLQSDVSNEITSKTLSAATKPTAPTNLAATSSGITTTSIPLTWTAPSDNGKNPDNTPANLTKYTVTYTSGSVTLETKTVTTAGTTLLGLLPGTIYTITVSATNTARQTSVVSNELRSATTSAATKPVAPTSLIASSGITTTSIPLTWTAPSDNGKNADGTGSSFKEYTVSYTPTGGTTQTKTVTTAGTTLSGLLSGTIYTITVSATNTATLESAASNEITSKTLSAATKPTAPTNLAATSSGITTTSIPLTWTAPSDNGKNADNSESSIKSYTVSYIPTRGATITKAVVVTGTTLSLTLSRLLFGAVYTIKISATNTAGQTSVLSAELTAETLSLTTKPTAPTALTTSSGSITTTSIPLTWTAPSDNGKNADGTGSSFKEYTVSYTPTGGATQTRTVTTVGTTLSGLLPGTVYTITVSATNTAGQTSVVSNELRSTTTSATTKPTSPTSLTASSGITTTSIPLTWTAPSDNGKNSDGKESSFKEYTVSYTTGVTSATKTVTTVGTTLTGLTPGSTYVIKVSVTNTAGQTSAASNEITSKTLSAATKPAAPTNLVTSIITAKTMEFTWSPPIDNGKNADGTKSEIIKYTLFYKTAEETVWSESIMEKAEGKFSFLKIPKFQPDTTYSVKIKATNTLGQESDASDEITAKTLSAATKPTAPTSFTASRITAKAMDFGFQPPSDNGKNADGTDSKITKITIYYKTAEETVWSQGGIIGIVKGKYAYLKNPVFQPDTTYSIRLKATNTAGLESVASNELTVKTLKGASKPTPPINLREGTPDATLNNISIPLLWTAPIDRGRNADGSKSEIKRYTVYYRTAGGISWTQSLIETGAGEPPTNFYLANNPLLQPETTYYITMTATNAANLKSDASDEISITTKKESMPDDPLGALIYKMIRKSPSTRTKALPSQADIDKVRTAKTIFSGLKASSNARVALRYVTMDGDDNNDGSYWNVSKRHIKQALDAITDASASKVYLLLVGPGTYVPSETLSMKNHVAIIGGFKVSGDPSLNKQKEFTATGDASNLYEKGPATVISGGNTRRVFYNTNLNLFGTPSTAVLARVTVANGESTANGGGMSNENSSVTIAEAIFSNNTAASSGGGMSITFGTTDTTITMTEVTFSDNTAGSNGGGLFSSNSSLALTLVTFSGNTAKYSAGGLYSEKTSAHSTSTILTRVTFSNNTATKRNGGGMYNFASSAVLNLVTFSGNTSSSRGGGLYNNDSSAILSGVTFSGNTSSSRGGGLYIYKTSPIISSSIFWGNTVGTTSNQIESGDTTSIPVIAHSVIQGMTAVASKGISNTNPNLGALANNGGFVQTMAIGGATSSVKDRGLYIARQGTANYYSSDNSTWYVSPLLTGTTVTFSNTAVRYTTDARGYGYSGRPDMGAYEYNGTAP